MPGARERFIRQIEDAAENVGEVPRHELRALLRRAALRLRNEPSVAEGVRERIESAIDDLLAAEVTTVALDGEVTAVMAEWAGLRALTLDEAVNEALSDWAISMGMMESKPLA